MSPWAPAWHTEERGWGKAGSSYEPRLRPTFSLGLCPSVAFVDLLGVGLARGPSFRVG